MKRNAYGRIPSRDRFGFSRKNRKKRTLILIAQSGVLLLCLGGILFSSVLLFNYIPRLTSGSPGHAPEPQQLTTLPTQETTTPTVTQPVREYLPSNSIVENYFGPLPTVESPEELKSFEAYGLYMGNGIAAMDQFDKYKDTKVNSFVIDLKESDGVAFDSQNALAREAGLVLNKYRLKETVDKCHANNIKVIGRIVCFKDPLLAAYAPDRSIADKDGNPLKFTGESDKYFINPYDQRNWDYIIELALEAVAAGVDEIQFDYVRFPVGGASNSVAPYFGDPATTPTKPQAINRFLQTARIRIQEEHGIPVTADVFGIILSHASDGYGIGQDWATVGLTGVTAVCPMIYPSHYSDGILLNGQTFDKPNNHPHDVVYNALMAGKPAASVPNYTIVRPYLQCFSSYEYSHLMAQIKAIEDAGYKEWIFWNPNGSYPAGDYQSP